MVQRELLDDIEKLAKRRGYTVKKVGEAVRLVHSEAPLYVEVVETSRGIAVRIGYEGLKDYIREIVDTEADPRSYIEELLDDLTALAHEVYDAVRRRGLPARLEAREAVMDVLEELEEAEEE
ncbi:hypothetical protein [Hyperthermus butylicus]|uniref:Uncharacterized protein n=1 Tax=Hyperthermus butylicus (strain DSM 5456 / JCM 9403 / PLM1-5) TaxID=415426 RepID=A2BJ00_HYPBU|nr:hypothetical protein [Hyperthermus butylicus]ABM79961.1 hypothetical protein Hbut_0085 [Hyperthermus butylicus DSM 5456]